MKHLLLPSLLLLLLPLLAQDADAPDPVADKSRALEARIGQIRDTSPQAADLMLELIDLYHQHGRTFGLIRTGQRFIKAHPGHPKHADTMLKLLDGLKAASLDEDILSTARQFLDLHGKHAQAGAVEEHLARVLQRRKVKPHDKAEAWRAVWTRGKDPAAGARAIKFYEEAGGKGVAIAASLAEEMVDRLPAGQPAAVAGHTGFHLYRKAEDWAGSTALGFKVIKKKLPLRDDERFSIHYDMGDNYRRQEQHNNAARVLAEARKLKPGHEEAARRHIQAMYDAQTKGPEMEKLAREFIKAFPASEYDMWALGFAAHAYAREEGTTTKAIQLAEQIIPVHAYHHDICGNYLRWKAVDEASGKQAAQFLEQAANRNTRDPYRVRYHLAFHVHRDRLKDPVNQRRVLVDLITKSPTGDSMARTAIHHALNLAQDEGDFRGVLNQVLAALRANPDQGIYDTAMHDWIRDASRDKNRKAHANIAKAEYDKLRADGTRKFWAQTRDRSKREVARDALLKANKLSPAQRDRLLADQTAAYLSNYKSEIKAKALPFLREILKRDPADYHRAQQLLEVAHHVKTDDKLHREAIEAVLRTKPTHNDYNTWIRLLRSGHRFEDPALARRCHQWIETCQKTHGIHSGYARDIGIELDAQGLKNEAMAYWRARVTIDRHSHNSPQCADEILKRTEDVAAQRQLLQEWIKDDNDQLGYFAGRLADTHAAEGDWAGVDRVMREAIKRRDTRRPRPSGIGEYPAQTWLDHARGDKEMSDTDKARIYKLVRDLDIGRPSALAGLALLELPESDRVPTMARLVAIHEATLRASNDSTSYDRFGPYGQAMQARQSWPESAALFTALLAHQDAIDANRKNTAREHVARAYSRMGSLGMDIAEDSPLAPLLEIGLFLRLGDRAKALESYHANQALFDEHKNKLPIELVLFAAESHMVAGGEDNHNRTEDILRSWLIANGEKENTPVGDKADVQLMLGRNYFKSGRFDVARSEFTSVKNNFPDTDQAIEADFGIGESFMAQKVFDKAEEIFADLAQSRRREIAIRAEFLRGVLANRRGDREEAREIFRTVLERVPDIDLANETLYNLAEVYGLEQRYMDQLELLRTVGRLGRESKRWHTPGAALSIVVQDSDLGISRGHTRIPVIIRTEPGGDRETTHLSSGGAGKGLFLTEIDTVLGQANPGDRLLQLKGDDVVHVDYPDEFKEQFKYQIMAENEIRIASDAAFEAQSQQIRDEEEESFTDRLAKEAQPALATLLQSLKRPGNQIKPGNPIYIRVEDGDRDQTGDIDTIPIKLTATSGDEVTVALEETGPHAGVFEGMVPTGELPAGALATDSAIDHNPLHAIDHDTNTTWRSEPDGATPKVLTIDMKDLHPVSEVRLFGPPSGENSSAVRVRLEGSYDGRFWFPLAEHPKPPEAAPLEIEYGPMTMRLFRKRRSPFGSWSEVADLVKNGTPHATEPVTALRWMPEKESELLKDGGVAALWSGKLVQRKEGGIRLKFQPQQQFAVMVDGQLVQRLTRARNQPVDIHLAPGLHDLAIVTWTGGIDKGMQVVMARENPNQEQVQLGDFRPMDFDLDATDVAALREIAPEPRAEPVTTNLADGLRFEFPEWKLRHVRAVVNEYIGESVAIRHVEIGHGDTTVIPTEADVLSLALNDALELTAGDTAEITYIDEITAGGRQRNHQITRQLTATYYNAKVAPMNYDFVRDGSGGVATIRKALMRVEPGERVGVEVTDFDMDETADKDTIEVEVALGDQLLKLEAIETEENSGVFRTEVDTVDAAATNSQGKLVCRPGETVTLRYRDTQNTFPGHSMYREAVVFVNEPTEAAIRVVGTQLEMPTDGNKKPKPVYAPRDPDADPDAITGVTFSLPITVEVIDPDAAKDSHSTISVELSVNDQPRQVITCMLSKQFGEATTAPPDVEDWALYEGRFIGQMVMQLGGPDSPAQIPYTGDAMGLAFTYLTVKMDKVTEEMDYMMPVLNLTGPDIVSARYNDLLRPQGTNEVIAAKARLKTDGDLQITGPDYETPLASLHVGEKLFVVANDPDMDRSDERDKIEIRVVSTRGEEETVSLEETLSHSGIFAGSFLLKDQEKPTPNNQGSLVPEIECFFGDTVTVHYVDAERSSTSTARTLQVSAPIAVGTDGLLAAFSKVFGDDDLAIQTQFHIAESYFELFKGPPRPRARGGRRTRTRGRPPRPGRTHGGLSRSQVHPARILPARPVRPGTRGLGGRRRGLRGHHPRPPRPHPRRRRPIQARPVLRGGGRIRRRARGLRHARLHLPAESAHRQRDDPHQRLLLQRHQLHRRGPGRTQVRRAIPRARVRQQDGLPGRPVHVQERPARRRRQIRQRPRRLPEGGGGLRHLRQEVAGRQALRRSPLLGRRSLPHGGRRPQRVPALQPLPLGLPGKRRREIRPRPPRAPRNAGPVRTRSQSRERVDPASRRQPRPRRRERCSAQGLGRVARHYMDRTVAAPRPTSREAALTAAAS